MMTEPRPSKKKTLLIVEDDPDIREFLKEFIQDDGYQVHGAANGREALEYLSHTSDRPGVILLDLMMPVMDGFQFVEAKNSEASLSKVPVVLMSADARLREKAEQLGAQGWVKKPLELDAVLGVVERYCDGK